MSEAGAPKRDPFQLFLIAAYVALCGLVIALSMQNRTLKARVSELETAVAAAGVPTDVLKPGDALPPTAAAASPTSRRRSEPRAAAGRRAVASRTTTAMGTSTSS